MSNESQGVPVSWPELRDPARGLAATALESVESAPAALEAPFSRPINVFFPRASQFACLTILSGPDALRPHVERMRANLDAAVAKMKNDPGGVNPIPRLAMFSVLNTLDCGGLAGASFGGLDAGKTVDLLIEEKNQFTEPQTHTAALAAAAAGRADAVPKLIRGGKLPAKVKPGETFGFNATGFIRYLAAAVASGAPADGVEPGWIDFVRHFPHKLAAGTLDWPDLLWAGRSYHTLAGRPVAGVAAAIRELIGAA